jgi:hypothetical protein
VVCCAITVVHFAGSVTLWKVAMSDPDGTAFNVDSLIDLFEFPCNHLSALAYAYAPGHLATRVTFWAFNALVWGIAVLPPLNTLLWIAELVRNRRRPPAAFEVVERRQ